MLDIPSLMLIAKNRGNTLTFRLLKMKIENCSGGLFIDGDDKDSPPSKLDMSHSQMLGKFEYGGGPIFKVVLEC